MDLHALEGEYGGGGDWEETNKGEKIERKAKKRIKNDGCSIFFFFSFYFVWFLIIQRVWIFLGFI